MVMKTTKQGLLALMSAVLLTSGFMQDAQASGVTPIVQKAGSYQVYLLGNKTPYMSVSPRAIFSRDELFIVYNSRVKLCKSVVDDLVGTWVRDRKPLGINLNKINALQRQYAGVLKLANDMVINSGKSDFCIKFQITPARMGYGISLPIPPSNDGPR